MATISVVATISFPYLCPKKKVLGESVGHVGGCRATSWSCLQRFNDVQPCSGENLDSSRPMLSMNRLPGGNSFNHICLVNHYSSTGTCLQIVSVKYGEIIHCPRVKNVRDVLNESFGSIWKRVLCHSQCSFIFVIN